jgi:hypothetical protein
MDVGRFVVASFADVDCVGIVPQLVEGKWVKYTKKKEIDFDLQSKTYCVQTHHNFLLSKLDVELYFAQEMPNLLWNVIPVKCRTASYVWQVVQKIHVSGVAIELVRE